MSSSAIYWGAAQVVPHQEQRAVENLRRQGWPSLYPFFVQRSPGQSPRPSPLFPGYVFVCLRGNDSWAAINYTRGVLRLLASAEGRPFRVESGFVESIRRCLVPHPDLPGGLSQLLHPGTEVRAIRGPMTGFTAVVSWSEEDRLGLLFNMLGRELPEVEFSIRDVELIES